MVSPQTGQGSPVRPWTRRPLFFSALSFAGGEAVGAFDGLVEGGPHRRPEGGGLLRCEVLGGFEGRRPRGVEDLVAVGVADARDEALVPQGALDLPPFAREEGGEGLGAELLGERVGAEPGDARHLLRVVDQVDGEPFGGAGLGEVEAVASGERGTQRQRPLAGLRRPGGQRVLPAEPARAGQMDQEVEFARRAGGGEVEELPVAGRPR